MAASAVQTWPVAMSVAAVAEPLPAGPATEPAERHPRESGDPDAAATSMDSRVRGNDGAVVHEESGAAARGNDAPMADADGTAPAAASDGPATFAAPAAPAARTATTASVGTPSPAPAFAPSSSGTGSVGGALVALLLVVGLILALAWLARRLPGMGAATGNRNLKLVGSLSIGPRERVVVVDVGGTQLLLSTGAGGTRTLHTLEQPLPEPEAGAASPFAQVLAQHFGKNK